MVKKLTGIGFASALVIGGAIVMATTPHSPASDNDKPELKEKAVKLKVLPKNEEMRTYLKSVAGFMEVPPRDGSFGASRVPTIHGSPGQGIPGYEEVRNLSKQFEFTSGVIGDKPYEVLLGGKTAQQVRQVPPSRRMRAVHYLIPNQPGKLYNTIDRQMIMAKLDQLLATNSDSMGYRADIAETDKGKLYLMSKAVKATDEGCYKCHSNVKKGDAIGHVYAVYTEIQP